MQMFVRILAAGCIAVHGAHAQMASTAAAISRANILPADCRVAPRPTIMPEVTWKGSTIQWAEWNVALGARRIPVQVVLAQFDPREVRLSLEVARSGNSIAPWTIDNAPGDVLLALNAGQFNDDGPWGWVVHRSREWQAPGTGSLAGALIVDTAGKVDIIDAERIAQHRSGRHVVEAVQSYPMLLEKQGTIPAALCDDSDEINLDHRDTRLAIGVRGDGSIIIAMTRYDGAGSLGKRLPIGPTTPEMAEIMRRAGAVRAMMLDGGLSAQMLVRDRGRDVKWPGLRAVPLALVVR